MADGVEILFRQETADDMKIGANASHFDDVDLIEGANGKLGIVAIHKGRRVCQQCGGYFDSSNPKLRMTPVHTHPEAPPVYLHAKCEVPPAKIFTMLRGLPVRRRVANIVKKSLGIEQAAERKAE
ncbi:MAG: hypothetical protein ACE5F6_00220 [Anaerolineae bacterium]